MKYLIIGALLIYIAINVYSNINSESPSGGPQEYQTKEQCESNTKMIADYLADMSRKNDMHGGIQN